MFDTAASSVAIARAPHALVDVSQRVSERWRFETLSIGKKLEGGQLSHPCSCVGVHTHVAMVKVTPCARTRVRVRYLS